MSSNPLAKRRAEEPLFEDKHHFTRPRGPLTEDDLRLYAEELNAGPMRGWFVARKNFRNQAGELVEAYALDYN